MPRFYILDAFTITLNTIESNHLFLSFTSYSL
jgi:hypothetical protein